MVDMTNDVKRFEQLFADRFTEKDETFMELKSKSLPNPVVIHPWKVLRKQWTKRWEYSSRRNQDERGPRGYHKSDDRHRQNSYDRRHDRAREGENSRERYRDRSEDGRRDRSYDSQDGRHRERKRDFHSSMKAYQER